MPGKPAKQKGVREGSKTETILALLKRSGGATLKEIMKATAWQAHSVRGFVSGPLAKRWASRSYPRRGRTGNARIPWPANQSERSLGSHIPCSF
jgi:hypothetical protein